MGGERSFGVGQLGQFKSHLRSPWVDGSSRHRAPHHAQPRREPMSRALLKEPAGQKNSAARTDGAGWFEPIMQACENLGFSSRMRGVNYAATFFRLWVGARHVK